MRRLVAALLGAIFCLGVASAAPTDTDHGYISGRGQGTPPTRSVGTPQGKLMAKRAAMVDLRRDLLERIAGLRVEARRNVGDLMKDGPMRLSIEGVIAEVEVTDGAYDGKVYTLEGRVAMKDLRRALLPAVPSLQAWPRPDVPDGAYRGLVVDARKLDVTPSVVLRIRSASGKAVYGPEFVDRASFVERGMCRFDDGIPKNTRRLSAVPRLVGTAEAAEPEGPFLLIRASGLYGDGTILVGDREAAAVERLAPLARVDGNVVVLVRTSALGK